MFLLKISVFFSSCFCINSRPAKRATPCLLTVAAPTTLPAQTFAKREHLPSTEENGAREVEINRTSQREVVGVSAC